MAGEFGGQVRFVEENYGDSERAKRLGVTRYPAIFVDDILVATPNDFGFYGKGDATEGGRYSPLRSATSHERFRADLERMIRLVLEGRSDAARAGAASAETRSIAAFPGVTLTDLEGGTLTREDLAGRTVLVEFWATWCPPCRGTLRWLGELQRRHGDRLAVIAIAIESQEPTVRRLAAELDLPLRWVIGRPEQVRAFGDVSAVPTLLLFGPDGRTAGTFFGAPPDLHPRAESALAGLMK